MMRKTITKTKKPHDKFQELNTIVIRNKHGYDLDLDQKPVIKAEDNV